MDEKAKKKAFEIDNPQRKPARFLLAPPFAGVVCGWKQWLAFND
jgi:hypothetical protein